MAIIAEISLDMTVFGTAGRLVSWAKLCPQARQSGKKATAASPGKGDPWLKGPLGEVAATAARYCDLGSGYYDDRATTERKVRNHIRQLEALGLTVTLAEDAA